MSLPNAPRQAVQVLLIDDSPSDSALIQETLNESPSFKEIHVIETVSEVLAYLRQEGQYANVPCPNLILLNLNLPGESGWEVLAQIKSDPGLKRIPVIVLTTSLLDQDVIQSYRLYANCYVVKPNSLEAFVQVIRAIEAFWLMTAELPPPISSSP